MSKPQIIIEDFKGYHNSRDSQDKLDKLAFKDLSTIMIIPCYSGGIHPKVVQNWMGIATAMNQKFIRIFATDMEVGAAYTETINNILSNPELSKFKFIFTLEHDNIVEPDVLLKIYPDMDKFDAIGSLYYTKGYEGKPMCYGSPKVQPLNFIPFEPEPNSVTHCNGLGMGATMFKMEMFKNKKAPNPLFETRQRYTPGVGMEAFTQDLLFFQEMGKLGYKFGCTTKTKTGHMDINSGQIW